MTTEREIIGTALKNLEDYTGIPAVWEPAPSKDGSGIDGHLSLNVSGKN